MKISDIVLIEVSGEFPPDDIRSEERRVDRKVEGEARRTLILRCEARRVDAVIHDLDA